MLKEIIHLDNEEEARRILMRLGNGLPQVEAFIEEWKAAKTPIEVKPVVVQKTTTNIKIEEEVDIPTQEKVEE